MFCIYIHRCSIIFPSNTWHFPCHFRNQRLNRQVAHLLHQLLRQRRSAQLGAGVQLTDLEPRHLQGRAEQNSCGKLHGLKYWIHRWKLGRFHTYLKYIYIYIHNIYIYILYIYMYRICMYIIVQSICVYIYNYIYIYKLRWLIVSI